MFFTKLARHRSTVMKSATAFSAFAYELRDESIKETENPIAPRQAFEKSWALGQSEGGKVPSKIDHLVVSAPGIVFVTANPGHANLVRVSSDSKESIERIQVVPHGETGLEIRGVEGTSPKREYLLTEVSLPTEFDMTALKVDGSSVVVVDDKVMVANAPDSDVCIELVGSGDIFVTSHTDLLFKSLQIKHTSVGDIQLIAPKVTTCGSVEAQVTGTGNFLAFVDELSSHSLSLRFTGSGNLKLCSERANVSGTARLFTSGSGGLSSHIASFKTDDLDVEISGSGSVKVVAKDSFVGNTITTQTAGSGDLVLASHDARGQRATYSVSGSGSVDARDMRVADATGTISGSGDILLRAEKTMTAVVHGSGRVNAVGDLPLSVSGTIHNAGDKPSRVDKMLENPLTPLVIPTLKYAFEHPTHLRGTFTDVGFLGTLRLLWSGKSGDRFEVRNSSGSSTVTYAK